MQSIFSISYSFSCDFGSFRERILVENRQPAGYSDDRTIGHGYSDDQTISYGYSDDRTIGQGHLWCIVPA